MVQEFAFLASNYAFRSAGLIEGGLGFLYLLFSRACCIQSCLIEPRSGMITSCSVRSDLLLAVRCRQSCSPLELISSVAAAAAYLCCNLLGVEPFWCSTNLQR